MLLLILSQLLLASAPIIFKIASRFHSLWQIVDKGTRLAVILLILLHVLPESFHIAGFPSLFLAFLGLILPSLFERLCQNKAGNIHLLSVLVALFGLVVHSMVDGASLALPQIFHDHHHHGTGHDHGMFSDLHALPFAVLIHQLPVGLLIWDLASKSHRKWFPYGVLCLNMLSTFLGYGLGAQMAASIHDSVGLALAQACFAGALLHVIFHRYFAQAHTCDHHCH